MTTLLVRDVMTIGVPVCHEAERCGDVEARLARQAVQVEVVGVLDSRKMRSARLAK